MRFLLPILFFILFAFLAAPIDARGPRCTNSKQCGYPEKAIVCDAGFCKTYEEMIQKYGVLGSRSG